MLVVEGLALKEVRAHVLAPLALHVNIARFFWKKTELLLGTEELQKKDFKPLFFQVAHLEDLAFVALPQFTSPGDPNCVALLQDDEARSNFCLTSSLDLSPHIDRNSLSSNCKVSRALLGLALTVR